MKLTKTEERGIEAIIWLQALAGITESKAKALLGWRMMDKHAREHTLQTYHALKGDN